MFLFEFQKSNQTRKNACISHMYCEVGGFEQINGGQGTEEAERKLVVRCINQDPSQSPGAVGGLGLPDTIGWQCRYPAQIRCRWSCVVSIFKKHRFHASKRYLI